MADTSDPPEKGSDEHRRQHRQRVLKGGTIITSIQNSEISCTLRNQHQGGAELKVPPESRVPDRFLLYVPVDGIAYRSEAFQMPRRGGRIWTRSRVTTVAPK